ncbi:MAG: hypothetical protein IPP79_13600 [Chitinophagaceae bacterium]|nr:hypothetical protein [Chitinophagaceae bacterium]
MVKKNPSYEDLEKRVYVLEHSLNRISDACVAFDTSMNFVGVNEAGAIFFESTLERLVGRNYFEVIEESRDSPVSKAFLNAIQQQKVEIIDAFSNKKNSWYSYRIYPSNYGISVFIHELTAADKAEAILRKSEVRVRTMLDELPDGVIVADEQSKNSYSPTAPFAACLDIAKRNWKQWG